MKNKVMPIILLLVIVGLCIFGIGKMINENANKEEAVPIAESIVTQLRYTVESNYIENSLVLSGTVVNHNTDNYVVVSGEIPEKTETEIKCPVYEDVSIGDTLFVINGKDYKSNVSGKVTDVTVALRFE